MNRCSGCEKNFRSVGAFDMHRVGGYGDAIYKTRGKSQVVVGHTKPTRRCLDTGEMVALEMQQDEKGTWRGPANAYFEREEPA